MAETERSVFIKTCPCTEATSTVSSTLSLDCECPRDEHDLVIHEENCLLYKNEEFIYPQETEGLSEDATPKPTDEVKKAGREALEEWRSHRDVGPMPAVLEATHPLMKRFQQTLREFLLKENALAEEEILNLKDELRLNNLAYDKDLEGIYKSDHDTNAQRMLIEEYESTLAQRTSERQTAEKRAKEAAEKQKRAREKLEQDLMTEREASEELEALTALCRQLEQWREETESELTVSQRMSDKMRAEKRTLADEKREMDMIIFSLSNEVWKLESKLEMFQKQLDIKNVEMEKINDKVTVYAAELEDLELDKRRLVSLWNSVLVNIQRRDKVYDSVRDDYRVLQENYRTLMNNLEITKKLTMEEMNKGKELTMDRDKITYDIEHATKLHNAEDDIRESFEKQIGELTESIEMAERDQELIQMENQTMRNIMKSTEKEIDRKLVGKMKFENEILANLQDCLLNDKSVEYMANGIKKMREMSRKQEITLMAMENQHAKMMLDIEVRRNKQAQNDIILQNNLAKVKDKEKELSQLEEDYNQKTLVVTKKQREFDTISKKFVALKEIFDLKSPQERRIEELEQQIKGLRESTEGMQHEWLRIQGHVVKVTDQHNKMIGDINLIKKQIQICEQKTMRLQAECKNVSQEKMRVEQTLRELRGKLAVLEKTRKDALDRNDNAQKTNMSITHEYAANLKDAEMNIIQLEEQIEAMDSEKMNLTQDLDRVQREALIWQRKGILAVELKKNMKEAKSAVGEIGQMRSEIHRMEVRREQLRRTGEKLAEDLAQYVTRRDTALEKRRACAAVEKAQSSSQMSQSTYHHKLRLARCDVARVTKDLAEAEEKLKQLQDEQERLDRNITDTISLNAQLEEQVASLMREVGETDRQKQWLLERVVRSQRLGNELATVIKRKSLRVKKPEDKIMDEYTNACTLNDQIKIVVERLTIEYPHFGEKLETIGRTLEIHSPTGSPRLSAMPAHTKPGYITMPRTLSYHECQCPKVPLEIHSPTGSPRASAMPTHTTPDYITMPRNLSYRECQCPKKPLDP